MERAWSRKEKENTARKVIVYVQKALVAYVDRPAFQRIITLAGRETSREGIALVAECRTDPFISVWEGKNQNGEGNKKSKKQDVKKGRINPIINSKRKKEEKSLEAREY